MPYFKIIVIFLINRTGSGNMNFYFYKEPKEVLILLMSSVA